MNVSEIDGDVDQRGRMDKQRAEAYGYLVTYLYNFKSQWATHLITERTLGYLSTSGSESVDSATKAVAGGNMMSIVDDLGSLFHRQLATEKLTAENPTGYVSFASQPLASDAAVARLTSTRVSSMCTLLLAEQLHSAAQLTAIIEHERDESVTARVRYTYPISLSHEDQVATTVTMRRDGRDGECSCQFSMQMGCPCRHLIALARALDSKAAEARLRGASGGTTNSVDHISVLLHHMVARRWQQLQTWPRERIVLALRKQRPRLNVSAIQVRPLHASRQESPVKGEELLSTDEEAGLAHDSLQEILADEERNEERMIWAEYVHVPLTRRDAVRPRFPVEVASGGARKGYGLLLSGMKNAAEVFTSSDAMLILGATVSALLNEAVRLTEDAVSSIGPIAAACAAENILDAALQSALAQPQSEGAPLQFLGARTSTQNSGR